ncbi:MAG TPA: hypothetical protein VHZ24_18510 [Pirellulales bacterium]|nr:hypothetical protein [Pirellulales bacterium]
MDERAKSADVRLLAKAQLVDDGDSAERQIELLLVLQNDKDEPLLVAGMMTDEVFDITIRTDDGKPAGFTTLGEKRMKPGIPRRKHRTARSISPHSLMVFRLNLSRYFDLPPGIYQIGVSVPVRTADSDQHLLIEAPTLRLAHGGS